MSLYPPKSIKFIKMFKISVIVVRPYIFYKFYALVMYIAVLLVM